MSCTMLTYLNLRTTAILLSQNVKLLNFADPMKSLMFFKI